MEIYLIKSNSHHSCRVSSKVKLVRVPGRLSSTLFKGFKFINPSKLHLLWRIPTNMGSVNVRFNMTDYYRYAVVRMMGEVAGEESAEVQYKYTIQIELAAKLISTSTRTSPKMLKVESIHRLWAGSEPNEEHFVPASEVTKTSTTMYPFELESCKYNLRIKCQLASGFAVNLLCGVFESMSVRSLFCVAHILGVELGYEDGNLL